mmetsp:Transcript_7928/g.10449  ORF Transcript_7928/g.10449 Transcript_7928/m.10449 type:complete len:372 (-) Transcript_7928:122-1237(-)
MIVIQNSVIPKGLFVIAAGSLTFKLVSCFLSPRKPRSLSSATEGTLRISVVGDAFADILVGPIDKLPEWGQDTLVKNPIEIMAGGCALNTAVQMAALQGLPWRCHSNGVLVRPPSVDFTFHSSIGADSFGSILLSRLFQAGVKPSLPKVQKGKASGACLVLTGAKDRAFVTYQGPVEELTLEELDREQLISSSHVHIGGFYNCYGLHSGLSELLAEIQSAGGTTSLTPQWDASEKWAGLDGLYPSIDVLIMNEDEAEHISKHRNHHEAISYFLQKGVKVVVVTLGKDGSMAGIKHHGKEIIYKGTSKKVEKLVDTTGAGDAFCAGFLFGWKVTGNISDALELGAACGACCVSKFGASVAPTHGELLSLLED